MGNSSPRNTRKSRAKSFWVLDAETDPFSIERNKAWSEAFKLDPYTTVGIPQDFIWGAYHHATEEYVEFYSAKDVAEFFRDRNALVYAHNGGRFDYMYLRDFINSDDPLLVIGGRIAKCRIGTSEFRDSLNIFCQIPLSEFGGKIEIDYSKMEPARRADPNVMAEIKRYLRQDCVLLAEKLQEYFDEFGNNMTQASSSMKYWAKNFNQTIPSQSKSDFDRYKDFYFGGRVQCFREGVKAEKFSVLDINSAYPYAMRKQHMFSTSGVRRRHLPTGDKLWRCLIKLDCSARSVFPWRDPDGALYFPDDEGGHRSRIRTYCVTGWEFMTALATDSISNIHIREIHYFPESVSFADYIDHFYARRIEAKKRKDKAADIFCKLFMNSLYGKFGQDCDNHSDYVVTCRDGIAGWKAKGYVEYKPWRDRVLMRYDKNKLHDDDPRRRYYNVATAASITGFVRAHLYRAANACSGLIYCDTDSISAQDVSALRQSDKLGDWKLEMECNYYAIAGKKLYAMRDVKLDWTKADAEKKGIYYGENPTGWFKTACKGVDLSPEQIIRVAQGETIEYLPEVPTYSISRDQPRYINRNVSRTYKDISLAN